MFFVASHWRLPLLALPAAFSMGIGCTGSIAYARGDAAPITAPAEHLADAIVRFYAHAVDHAG